MKFTFILLAFSNLAFGQTAPPKSGPKPAQQQPRWRVTRSVNELDRTTTVTVTNGSVFLRCGMGVVAYVLPFLPNLGHRLELENGYGQSIRYRMDDGEVRAERWDISDDFDALFIAPAFLPKVLAGKKLIVEYQPEYVVKRTMTFDVGGLKEAAIKGGCDHLDADLEPSEVRSFRCTGDEIRAHNAAHPDEPWPRDFVINEKVYPGMTPTRHGCQE